MDSDCAHLHDGVCDHPKSLQAEPLDGCSLRDVSNVLKTSQQQLDPASPLARGRISFKIQPRSPAMTWLSGAAALWHSVSTDGGRPRENQYCNPRRSWLVPRIAWRSTQDHFRDSSVSRITRTSLGEGGTYSQTSTTSFFRAAVSAQEGERINPLRDHGAAPTSPPGGV